MRLLICIFALTVGVWFVSGVPVVGLSQKGGLLSIPAKSTESSESAVIFLTGNELGALQPCGCSGGQLGGLDRRGAVFGGVASERRLIIDTGGFVQSDGEQDLIKFNILVQAFGLLGYDLANLTASDLEFGRNLGFMGSGDYGFEVITLADAAEANLPAKFTKELSSEGGAVTVTVAAFDAENNDIEQIEELLTREDCGKSLNMLIVNECGNLDDISGLDNVDCVVCPSESDEPMVISGEGERPLIISMGRYGKYVVRLGISFDNADQKRLNFSAVAVTEELTSQKSLVELYKAYQQLVKEANLLERHPRFILPDGLEYANSKSCKSCHEYEYAKWSTKAHADAYATLEKVGSQYDPECVICHVVGMEYETGFISEGQTADLKNVGCENCHGPGSEHNATLGRALTTGPKSECIDCHTPDHSAEYSGNEQEYREKIIHWKEPNTVGGVKSEGK